MDRKNIEILKSYILIILLVVAFIQVGILWNLQNHWFPFNFITAFFQNTVAGQDTAACRTDYFKPYKLIVSGGDSPFHWVVDRNNSYYNSLWNESSAYLKEVLHASQMKEGLQEDWWSAASKKAVIVEFSTNIRQDLLAWFLNDSGVSSNAPSGVFKMAILPWEDINNTNTVYVYDGKRVYKYVVPFHSGFNRDEYDKIFEKFEEGTGLGGYSIAKDYPINKDKTPDSVRKDLLFSATGSESISKVVCSIPDKLTNFDDIETSILGKDKDSFDSPADSGANYPIVFKNVNNKYSIYKNGVVTYQYLTATEDSEKSDLRDSFENAAIFLNSKKKALVSGADEIYLSGIDQSGNDIEFTFNYIVNGLPVYVENTVGDKEDQPSNSAITIVANSKRVVECRWVARKFEKSKDSPSKYDISFPSLLDTASKTYRDLDKKEKSFFIDDAYISYRLTAEDVTGSQVNPVWIIKTAEPDGKYKYYDVEMKVK